MEIIVAILLYVFIVVGFISFGKFLKECDESVHEQINTGSSKS